MEQRHAVSGTPEKGSPFPLLAEGKVLNHTDFFFFFLSQKKMGVTTLENSVKQV